jgi:hypothetical protein
MSVKQKGLIPCVSAKSSQKSEKVSDYWQAVQGGDACIAPFLLPN